MDQGLGQAAQPDDLTELYAILKTIAASKGSKQVDKHSERQELTDICRKLLPLAAALCTLGHAADKPSAADVEFFETRIRPVLAKNCYGCHSSETKSPMGGLF